MATQVQIRRGTSSQVAAFTGAEGEIVVNTTNDSVHVNDGSTAGGFELARVDGSNWAITNDITTTSNIDVGTVTADGLTVDGDINLASGGRARGAAGGDFQVSSGLTNDASEPTYTFRGDPDTGIFYGGANTVGITTGGKQRINIASNGDVSLYEDTGTTPKMVWDSSAERLGIGTSSPSTKLHLGGTAPGDSIIRQDSTASGTNWEIGERSAGKWQIFEDDSDSIVATFMSTGSVGIGTSSPDTLLELVGADPILTIRDSSTSSSVGNATLRLAETGASDTLDQYFDIKATAGQLQIIDNWNEGGGTGTRVVIDDSGNLLVGTTDTDPANNSANSTADDGVAITAVGEVRSSRYLATANSGAVGFFNRTGTDGDIVRLRKSGSSVGSIGTLLGNLTVGTGDTGVQFNQDVNAVIPHNISTGANVDNSIDLGYSDGGSTNLRFKDLYLSGGAFLGGTTAANYLDDYEEGTWTPTTDSGTITTSGAKYTKIGDVFTLIISNIQFSDYTTSETLAISNLPFLSNEDSVGSTMASRIDTPANWDAVYMPTGGTTLRFYANSSGGFSAINRTELAQNNSMYIQITYTTNS